MTINNEFEKLENILYRKIISDTDNADSIDAIIKIILTEFCKATGWAFGEAWLPNDLNTRFICNPSYYKIDDTLEQFRQLSTTYTFKKGDGLIGSAWGTQKLCWFENVSLDSKFLRKRIAAACGIKSGFAIPVLAKDEVVAILAFYIFEEIQKDEKLIELVSTVVKQLGMLIKRKQTEEKLLASNKLMQSLIDGITDPIFIKDLNGKYLLVNAATLNFLKRTKDEVIGKTDFEILPENIAKELRKADLEVIEKKMSKVFDEKLVRDNGEAFFLSTKTVFYDEKENVSGVLGIARDVTKLKEQEQALINSEKKYKNIFDNAVEGMFQTSIDGKIISVNNSFVKIFGFNSSEELLSSNMNAEKFYPDPNVRKQLLKEISEKGYIKNLKSQAIAKNGEKIWCSVNIRLVKDEVGNPLFLEGTAVDITEIKEIEDLSQRLFSAIEQTADSVVITDKEGIIQYVNPAFETTTGYSGFEAIGKTPRILKSDFHSQKFFEHLWNTILNGEIYKHIIVNKKKTGETYYSQKTISPIRDENGNITNFISTDKDITELITAQQEIIKAKENAEDMNKLKSYFLANISHELRTPLIGILGFSELLLDELENDFHKNMIETIFAGGKRLSETLNLILDLTKIESQKFDVNLETINVNAAIYECIDSVSELVNKQEAELRFIEPSENILLKTDYYMFKVIVKNVINNALKYSPKGLVNIELSAVTNKKQNLVKVKIVDNGIGIPKEKQEVIFDEFRQVSEGLSRTYEGMGLGLTIAKKFTDILSGKIELESELEKGTIITLTFPASKTEPLLVRTKEIVPTNFEKSLAESKLNILLVEDDEISVKVIKRYLENICNLEVTRNADLAFESINEKEFDVILLDINLGSGKTGLDIIKDIRQISKYLKVPIIAVTAYAMMGDKEEFLKAGCTHYISKPFTRKEFLELLYSSLN